MSDDFALRRADDPPRPLRVAHVIASLDCGGAEQMALHLAREGRELGQEVTVICLLRRGVLAERFEACAATVECLDKPPGFRWRAVVKLREVFNRRRIEVIHSHQINVLMHAGLAARWAGIRAVLHTEHGKRYGDRPRMRWPGRFAGCLARRFCCVSSEMAAEIRQFRIVPDRKLRVVPNGIDTSHRLVPGQDAIAESQRLRRSLGIPTDAPVVGTLGRLHEVKRLDVLLRAFALLPAIESPPQLLIVGDGPRMADLRRLAGELGVSSRVHFPGYQSATQMYLQIMDVFALTSRSEGQPLTVLEAGLAGLPVVASRVGGLQEMIDDGGNGFLFPEGNHPAAAALLGRLLADPALRRRVGDDARARVIQSGSARAVAEAYQREYLSLLGEKARRISAIESPRPPDSRSTPRACGHGVAPATAPAARSASNALQAPG
jgi:glycosyltransferase involved in cell wall biosynthesis